MSDSWLIKNGHLLTQDSDGSEFKGDILVRNGRIEAIGPNIDADVEVIDAQGHAVLPGFIDTHRHTWQTALRGMAAGDSLMGYHNKIQGRFGALFTPEDVYAGNLLGAVAAAQGGITTLCDESHVQNSPLHTDAAVTALRDSGIRAVFDYGWPSVDVGSWMHGSDRTHPTYIADLLKKDFWRETGLVTVQLMARGPLMTSIEITARDLAFARELGLRSVMHVAGGSIAQLEEAGLMGADLTFVHCCTNSDEELAIIRERGASISSSPNLELNMLGLGAPPLRRFLAAGIRPSLSVDVETSVGGDMFSVMRAALLSQTAERLYQPDGLDLPTFNARDVIGFATIEGARACGLGDVTGSLEVGKRADIILINLHDSNLAPVEDEYVPDIIVSAAHPGNVDTVMIDGQLRRGRGKPVDTALLAKANDLAAASRTRLKQAAAA